MLKINFRLDAVELAKSVRLLGKGGVSYRK
jgi:hypothetical protein